MFSYFLFPSDDRATRYRLSRKLSFGSMYVSSDICSCVLTVFAAMKMGMILLCLPLLPLVNDREFFFLLSTVKYIIYSVFRSRRATEKALYMTEDGQDNVAATVVPRRYVWSRCTFPSCTHPTLSKRSPNKTSLVKISKSTGGDDLRLPDPSQAPRATIKPEPLDEDENTRRLRSAGMKKSKEKPVVRNTSPIVISSDESDAPTPRAGAKSATFISDNRKKRYVRYSIYFCFLSYAIA